MPELREVELRIAVAEGVLSGDEAEAFGDEARRVQQSPLRLLVEQGRLSDQSFQSMFAAALNDPVWQGAHHDGTASTFTMQAAPPTATDQAFPIPGWDRYTAVRFLGKGGMGNVFLAIDTRLRREVAIKFVRGDDAEHVRRLIVEARTQARVSHERVCKVYEVDEVDGKVFIAMQYIHGVPLGRCAGLTLEQKVMLVRGAADGIHEAHRQGIIHRDIKPSNIMVERCDDGEIRPYVVDFGLARSAQEAGTTLIGALLGTPHYMAPEQASGDPAKLDRRADVYSLGATLYQLLTGATALPGETMTQVLHNLATREPRPPRAVDPSIPVDLEAIVLKCLEKDRAARYDSARALTDDLDRFLDGEPVAARPAGAWYRLRKRLAKHRRLVAAGAAVVVALGVAIGWAIATSRAAAAREQFARRFTELVEDIEARARYSALSPRHDIEPDRAALRDRMARLAREIDAAGDVAAGPGHYALGRGYLALDDAERARAELDLAWQGGFHELRVAYAEAQALGRLYQQALVSVARIEDRALRLEKQHEIERRYRAPALSFLTISQGAAGSSLAYTSALSAFYRESFAEALTWLDLGAGEPWLYEAPQLRGDILFARGVAFVQAGNNDGARRDFAEGSKAYAAAATIGASAPALYVSLGTLEYTVLVMELYGSGDMASAFERARAAAAHALDTAPHDYDALVLFAKVHRSFAEYQASRGTGVDELLTSARTAAEQAAVESPERSEAWLELAAIYRQWGDFQMEHAGDPRAVFRQAAKSLELVGNDDHDVAYYGGQSLLFSLWAEYEDRAGIDSQVTRGKAIEAFTQAIAADPNKASVWTNLGIDRFKRASRPHASNPEADLREAITALDQATRINVRRWVPYFYRGRVHVRMAQRAWSLGRDPGDDLERAERACHEGLGINPDSPQLHNERGLVLKNQARAAWDRGEDPEPLLAQAEAEFARAIAVAPQQVYGYDNRGSLSAQRARYQRSEARDPTAALDAAVAQLTQASEQFGGDPSVQADLGMAHVIRAAHELERGGDPRASLQRAFASLGAALASNPRDAQSQRYLGEARAVAAEFAARQGRGNAKAFTEAEAALELALELEPDELDTELALGELDRAWAAWQPDTGAQPTSPVAHGLARANRLVERHPVWPDALVLRASLRLLQAESAREPAQRRALAAAALHDLTDARAIHPALVAARARELARAQQLSELP